MDKTSEILEWMQDQGYDRKACQEIAPIITKYLNQKPNNYLIVNKIKELSYQFKKDQLPEAEEAFSSQAEAWAGIKFFIQWLESKVN